MYNQLLIDLSIHCFIQITLSLSIYIYIHTHIQTYCQGLGPTRFCRRAKNCPRIGRLAGVLEDLGREHLGMACKSAAASYATVWHGLVWYGMVRYSTVRYGMVWYVSPCMVWYIRYLYSTEQCTVRVR